MRSLKAATGPAWKELGQGWLRPARGSPLTSPDRQRPTATALLHPWVHVPACFCSLVKHRVWQLIKEKTVVLFLSSLRTPDYFYCSNNIAENFVVFELGITSEPSKTSRPGLRDHSLGSRTPPSWHQDPAQTPPPASSLLLVTGGLVTGSSPHSRVPTHAIWLFGFLFGS